MKRLVRYVRLHVFSWGRFFSAASVASLMFFVGCQQRPIDEMTLADVAVKAAQKAKADSLAADQFRKAENYFLRAKRDFTEGYYDSARKYANDARKMAEQAEYKSLQKQLQVRGGGAGAGTGAPDELEDATKPEGK